MLGRDARRRHDFDLERRRVADAERLRQVEARVAASPLSTTSTETDWLGVSTKWNVLSAGSGRCRPCTTPRTAGSASVNGAKVTDADGVGATLTRLRFDLVAVDLERDRHVARRVGAALVTPAVTVIRSWPENDARAKVTDGTDRFVVLSVATESASASCLAEVHVLGAGPARLLEVGDEDRLAALQRRARQDALGQLQRRAVARRARRDACARVERRLQPPAVGRGADMSPRRSGRTARASPCR